MKLIATLLLTALMACASSAAVPIRWQVETSRLQPAAFDCYHGETLELEAAFNSYGKPLAIEGEAALYYQTNGMGAAWWSAPATVSSNRIAAAFTPAMDPGAAILKCFLGGTTNNYRAAFTLRFANSPGAAPNELQPPLKSIDFDHLEVLNPPWPSPTGVVMKAELGSAISNAVTKAYVEGLGISSGGGGVAPTNAVITGSVSLVNSMGDTFRISAEAEGLATTDFRLLQGGSPQGEWAWLEDRSGKTMGEELQSLDDSLASQQLQVSQLSQTSDELWNFLMAENFRVTVTNYDSTAHAPEASFEYRMNTNESFRTVWSETNGLKRTHTSATNDAIRAAKAEIEKPENRAWGRYDATTGAPAPEGIVQVSAEGGIMIGGGMGFTSVAAAGGEYWVLSATDPTLCRTGTNGVFQIIDADGNAAVTVRKGDKRLVPAPAGSINVTDTSIVISYLIESAEHPEIECSATLDAGGTWYAAGAEGAPFGSAVWTGSSGAWTATIPKGAAATGFFRASYWAGGGTVVSYGAAAMEMQRVKIGEVEYTVGTATISGHTVLTLEVAP